MSVDNPESGDSPVVVAAETKPEDQQAIEADIAHTRQQLGDTVEALAAKADVKAQARDKVADVKGQATEKVNELRGRVTAAAAQVSSATPAPVRDATIKTAATAKRYRLQLTVGAAVTALVSLLMAWWRRRRG